MAKKSGQSGGTTAPSGGNNAGLSSGHAANGSNGATTATHNNNANHNGNGGTTAGHAQQPALGNHSAVPQAPAPGVSGAIVSPAPSPVVANTPIGAPHNSGNGGTTAPSVGTPPINPNYNNDTGGIAPQASLKAASDAAQSHANGGTTVPSGSSNGSQTGGVAAPAPSGSGGISIPHGSSGSGGGVSASSSASGAGGSYTVVHGDTLSGIAASHGISLARLESLNPQIKNPDLIFPGQSVNLGGASGTVSPAASSGSVGGSGGGTAAPASTGPSTAVSTASAPSGSYTVVHGDTLSGIAAAHGMSLSHLESLNPQINNPDLIFPGQSINLGGGGTAAPAVSTPASPTSVGGGTAAPASAGPAPITPPNSPSLSPTSPNKDKNHNDLGSTSPTAPNQNKDHGLNLPPNFDPAIHGPANQIPGHTITPKVPKTHPTHLIDPAAKPQGGTHPGSAFPKSSTYPPTDSSSSSTALDKLKNLGAKVKGWGSGNSSSSPDPAKKAVFVNTSSDTNPLHIKDGNQTH